MKPFEFHPEAAAEAALAADHYDQEKPDLGESFRAELQKALARIGQNPQFFAPVSRMIRRCSLHRFPYSVYFEEQPELVFVTAVGHHRRQPKYWAKRRSN